MTSLCTTASTSSSPKSMATGRSQTMTGPPPNHHTNALSNFRGETLPNETSHTSHISPHILGDNDPIQNPNNVLFLHQRNRFTENDVSLDTDRSRPESSHHNSSDSNPVVALRGPHPLPESNLHTIAEFLTPESATQHPFTIKQPVSQDDLLLRFPFVSGTGMSSSSLPSLSSSQAQHQHRGTVDSSRSCFAPNPLLQFDGLDTTAVIVRHSNGKIRAGNFAGLVDELLRRESKLFHSLTII